MGLRARVLPAQVEQSARDRAYAHIQSQIAAGSLRAGTTLSEVALAKDLGISRTPVREAIGQLASEGLLEQSPNRGAVVARLRRSDIIELYELREALEVFAGGKAAAQQLKDHDLQRLHNLASEIPVLAGEIKGNKNAGLDAAGMQRFVAADLAFHTSIMRLAGNSRIVKVVNETRLLIRIFAIQRHGHSRRELEKIAAEHRAIADGLAVRDSALVSRLLAQHIQASRQERLDEFDRWEHDEALQAMQFSVTGLPG